MARVSVGDGDDGDEGDDSGGGEARARRRYRRRYLTAVRGGSDGLASARTADACGSADRQRFHVPHARSRQPRVAAGEMRTRAI